MGTFHPEPFATLHRGFLRAGRSRKEMKMPFFRATGRPSPPNSIEEIVAFSQ